MPLAVVLAAACTLAACDWRSIGVAAVGSTPSGREASIASRPLYLAHQRLSSYGRFIVLYHPFPDPIPVNESFDIEVVVRDARDRLRAVPDVTLGINAEMSSHSHGMNVKPIVTRTSPDTFKVEGMMLHMPGQWTLNVDLTHAGITERAVFDVVLQ